MVGFHQLFPLSGNRDLKIKCFSPITLSHLIPFCSVFHRWMYAFWVCFPHVQDILRNIQHCSSLQNPWKMWFMTGLNGKTLLGPDVLGYALGSALKTRLKSKRATCTPVPPKQTLLIAESFQIGRNRKIQQDWACVSVVRSKSGFCKSIKVLRNDKAELVLPFSKGCLVSSQMPQRAGSVCNSLFLFNVFSQF